MKLLTRSEYGLRVGRTVHETQRRDRLGSSSETLSCPRLLVEKEIGADVFKELLGTEQPTSLAADVSTTS